MCIASSRLLARKAFGGPTHYGLFVLQEQAKAAKDKAAFLELEMEGVTYVPNPPDLTFDEQMRRVAKYSMVNPCAYYASK